MPLKFYPEADPIERDVRLSARSFSDRRLRPTAIPDDEGAKFRRDIFAEAGDTGLVGLTLPKEYGGAGYPSRAYYACQEELARGSASFSIATGVTALAEGGLLTFGNAQQKTKWLPKLARGEWLGAFSLSEPQSGSDAASLKLQARKCDGGYRLTGTKAWCSNAGHADLYLVMARTSEERYKGITAFVVLKDTPGFRSGKQENKLGLRASSLAELIFEDAFVPDSHRLGEEGQGFEVALSQLDSGRISIGATGLGIAVEAMERAWMHIVHTQSKGYMVVEGDKHILADHFASAQALKSLLAEATRLKDAGTRFTAIASQIKLLGSELAVRTTGDSVLIMGEKGYTREAEVERLMRDAKALQIVEGTNQIQRAVLAREMESMMMA